MEIKELFDAQQSFHTKANEQLARFGSRLDAIEAAASRAPGVPSRDGEFQTGSAAAAIAAKLWETDQFKAAIQFKDKLEFRVEIPVEQKTAITSAAVGSSTPGILIPDRVSGIIGAPVERVRVKDLLGRFPTTSNAIEYVKENAYTNAASPTAETISKPESALTFTIESLPVRTLAHWLPCSVQIVQDFAGLQQFVETRLIDGLEDIEDHELMNGDGTGQHLSGLSSEATAYDTARNVSGDTSIDKINHAISQLEELKAAPTGVILNPRDWRKITLLKEESGGANTGGYLLPGLQSSTRPNLWGLPIAITTACPVGHFFVGAFKRLLVGDRMSVVVEVSNSHADYFVRNMLAIRCESRMAGVAVGRNDLVVYGSL